MAAGIAVLAIAGCGGGSDETEPEALSKAQYIKQADAICNRTNDRQEALLKQEIQDRKATGVPSNSERSAFVTNSGLPPLEEEADRLEALGGPTGEEDKAEALVSALRKAVTDIEAEPLAFAEAESEAFAPVEQIALKLGLKVCGYP